MSAPLLDLFGDPMAAPDECSCAMPYDCPEPGCLVHGESPEIEALLDVLAWDSATPTDTWDDPYRRTSTLRIYRARELMAHDASLAAR